MLVCHFDLHVQIVKILESWLCITIDGVIFHSAMFASLHGVLCLVPDLFVLSCQTGLTMTIGVGFTAQTDPCPGYNVCVCEDFILYSSGSNEQKVHLHIPVII